jgi:hypothetical protein
LRNYVTGHAELGLDLTPVLAHFSSQLPAERVEAIAAEALRAASALTEEAFTLHEPEPYVDFTPVDASRSPGDLPLISCIFASYNRPPDHQHLIEEAIESFLRQTYPNKELIVLNDCPDQELVCDAPGVRVVNVAERFPTLGDKQNAAIRMANGDLIAVWDDDDLSLPWRLSLSVDRLGEADYFNPRAYWFLDGRGLHADHAMGYAQNASLFTRTAFEAVGGYPAISLGADAEMDTRLGRLARVIDPLRGSAPLKRTEWFYIYRWGVSPVHLSGKAEGNFYGEIGTRPVTPGRFHLTPHWRRDYEAETRALLDAALVAAQ